MQETEHILALLQSDDPESMREGAQLAGDHKLSQAIPFLTNKMCKAPIGVLDAIDRSLRKIGGTEVVHAMIPMLRSEDAPCRNIAMDILREHGHCDISTLQALLLDDDPDIRIFASDILGSIKDILVVPSLCQSLLHDPEVNVRYQAAVSLGKLAFPEAAPCLNKALNDEEWVQFAVVEALTVLRVESSIPALLGALEHASDLVASNIVDALGEMGNVKAVFMLLKRLDHSPAPLRNKIVKAIVNLLGENSLNLLGSKECARLRNYMVSAIDDEDTTIQDAAVRGFASLGGDGATKAILKVVATLDVEDDTQRLLAIAESLKKLGYTAELEQGMKSTNESVLHAIIVVLASLTDPRVDTLLINSFWDQPRDIQREIITVLARRGTSDQLDFFFDVLEKHTDGIVIRGAIAFLATKGDPAQTEDVFLSLLKHNFDDVKESALHACVALNTPSIKQHFVHMTSSSDPVQRMMGVYALGCCYSEEYLDILRVTINDESPDVRKQSIEALGKKQPLTEERLALIKDKLSDENSDVRMSVVDTLGKAPDQYVEQYLVQGLDDDDPWVRVRCIERIGERKSPQATEKLIHLLGSDNPLIVINVINVLGEIGGETVFRALLTMLDHPDHDIQHAAEEAIEAIHRKTGE